MHLAFPQRAALWIACGIPAALLALAAFALLPLPRPVSWFSTVLALTVAGAAMLAATWRRSPGASAPTTAIVGS